MNTNSARYKWISTISQCLFLCLTMMVLIVSCSEEDVLETDADLLPFFQIFADEAEERGITVDYEAARIEGLIQDISNPVVQGQCFYNEEKPRKVIIDEVYWNNATFLEKEFIIFHELGHCFLDRSHLDDPDSQGNCVSIMHSNPGVCNFFLTQNNREDYLDELFSN